MNSSELSPQPSSISSPTADVVIRSVELLRPQPGDVVLLTVPDETNAIQRSQIARAFQDACGPDVKIAVLRASTSVRVVRVADIPAEGYPAEASPPGTLG